LSTIFSNLQKAIIEEYCHLGSKECIRKYQDIFNRRSYGEVPEGVAAPLRAKVYCYGIKEGGDDAFDKMIGLYYAETVQLEKRNILQALGCHRDITALKGLLLLALDRNSSFVRLQDISYVFSAVSGNPAGKEFMLNFLLERWDEILERLPTEHKTVNTVIANCAAGVRTDQQIHQVSLITWLPLLFDNKVTDSKPHK
ncbi:hypothetical protein COOONC_15939, partial [Cooperia oncophora]